MVSMENAPYSLQLLLLAGVIALYLAVDFMVLAGRVNRRWFTVVTILVTVVGCFRAAFGKVPDDVDAVDNSVIVSDLYLSIGGSAGRWW